MDTSLHREIVEFLTPYMNDRREREASVRTALHGCEVLKQIDWEGSASVFTSHLISKLEDFGICEPDELSLQTLLLHLGSTRGVDVSRRALKLCLALANTRSGIADTRKTSDPLQYQNPGQRENDLRLIARLWVRMNSRNIVRLDNDTQYRMLEYEFYRENFGKYLSERSEDSALRFISHVLEAQFLLYDEALGAFDYQLFQSAGVDDFQGREIVRPDYKLRELEHDMQVYKEKEWDKTIDKLLELRRVHETLVAFLKRHFPEFDFFGDSDNQ